MTSRTDGNLLGLTHNDVVSLAAWKTTLNQKNIVVLPYLDDLKILSRATHGAHVTGHLEPLIDVTGEKTATNGA